MRTLDESRKRWIETFKGNDDLAALQQAVKASGPSSPCEAGCRSVCWKVFLLFREVPVSGRRSVLHEAREDYEKLRGRYLEYIKHPELLAELTVDPLADDPESPWDRFRHDEVVRAEILQDVRRLPDDPFYHQEAIQTLILDILFIFCKQNPEAGGYRQGMHELLAPLVYVLNEDTIGGDADSSSLSSDADAEMRDILDSSFIEHDAYALFSKIMSRAKSFYETSSAPAAAVSLPSTTADTRVAADPSLPASISEFLPAISPSPAPAIVSRNPVAAVTEESTIVELSKEIHEGSLMKVDPELALHLKNIEILPQIFLIRWIRLLFGREFPFEQHLVLWDSIFAFDPKLNLVPLICVAMLLRIRWQLIGADYSVALQSLLKYPAPEPPYGPHTFMDDAVFLRDHLDALGGAELISKYTGRSPARVLSPLSGSSGSTRPTTPAAAFAAGLGSLRSRTLNMARSPLRASRAGSGSEDNPTAGLGDAGSTGPSTALSPSRFIQRREGVEALFQGARNVFERGEKLGINQAVRDAMGEIKRNVAQGLQEAKQAAAQAQRNAPSRAQGQTAGLSSSLLGSAAATGGQRRLSYGETMRMIAEMELRNRQLATMLDETIVSLKAVAKSASEKPAPTNTDQPDEMSTGAELQQEKQKQWVEEVEIVAAKVQFVKVYLEDSTLVLPVAESEEEAASVLKETPAETPLETTNRSEDKSEPRSADEEDLIDDHTPLVAPVEDAPKDKAGVPAPLPRTPRMQTETADTDVSFTPPLTDSDDSKTATGIADDPKPAVAESKATPATLPVVEIKREVHTVPARSSLAQSSFAWMLEPGDTPASVSSNANNSTVANSHAAQSASGPSKKSGPSRARHAFLFGDSAGQSPLGDSTDPLADTSSSTDPNRPAANRTNSEVFDLEPLRRPLGDKE